MLGDASRSSVHVKCFRLDCKQCNGCILTARMNDFFNVTSKFYDSEIILGKSSLTCDEFSTDQWFFTTELYRS